MTVLFDKLLDNVSCSKQRKNMHVLKAVVNGNTESQVHALFATIRYAYFAVCHFGNAAPCVYISDILHTENKGQ